MAPINPAAIVLLGAYTILWGFWLANPWWDVFTAANLYYRMSDLAPEHVWGFGAMLSGAAMLYGVARPSYRNLMIGSTMGFLQWFLSAVMYFLGDWRNTGGITSLFISLYALYIYINIKANKTETSELLTD